MSTSDGTRVAYYDADGFHFDAAGIIAVVVPDRLPLPTEDVAYPKLKDDDGNLLINYEAIEGGYAISSLGSGRPPQPLELVATALGEEGSPPTPSLTLDSPPANGTMPQAMPGSAGASLTPAL